MRPIGFLVFPDFQLLDAAGPIAAFETASRIMAEPVYRLHVLAAAAGPVVSSSGVALLAQQMTGAPRFDTLLVAGGIGARDAAPDPEMLAWLRAAAAGTRRVASVCTGAFLLAAAGLLDGRRATTHWQRAALFARRFPRVRVEPDRIFVRDGNIWTSAGITAGIDLALALIEDDLGKEVAKRSAIGLAEISIPQTETTVGIGEHEFARVPTGLHETAIFPGEAGLFGNALRSRFSTVPIDAIAGRLILEGNRQWNARLCCLRRFPASRAFASVAQPALAQPREMPAHDWLEAERFDGVLADLGKGVHH